MKVAELFATIGLKIDQKPLKEFDKNLKNSTKSLVLVSKPLSEFDKNLKKSKKELFFFSKPLRDFDRNLKELKKGILFLPAILSLAVFAIDRFVDSSVQGAVSLRNFQRQTGLFSADLQRLQIAGQLSDLSLSAEQVTQSVIKLQGKLTDIRLGRGDTAGFRLLEIDVIGKDAFQVIEELRGAIQGLEPSVAINLLEQIGLSRNFFNVLRLGKKEFESLGAGIFRTTEQTKVLEDLGIAMTKFRLELGLVKDLFVIQLAPFIISGVNLFENFGFAANKVLEILQEFPVTFKAIKIAALGLGLGAVFSVLKAFKKIPIAGRLLPGPIGAAVGIGGALVVDDIISASRGDESFLKSIDNFILRKSQKNERRLKSDLNPSERIMRSMLIPFLRDAMPRTPLDTSNSNVFNNNFIFNTNENSNEIANKIENVLLKQQTLSLSEINNGVVA